MQGREEQGGSPPCRRAVRPVPQWSPVLKIQLCAGMIRRSFIMVKQVKVSNFTEVKGIVSAAAKCYNDVGVHDMKGSIADAKSILGMMSLDYSHPVKIVCEDERDLNRVVNAMKQ